MKKSPAYALLTGLLTLAAPLPTVQAQPAPEAGPYKLVNAAKVGGTGGFDYVYADADGRRLYIPRGNRVTVFDLDTLKPAGEIANTSGVHGAAVDPKTHHGFSSSRPVAMWDSQTLATIKTIDVQGGPDGILFEPATERIYILSHRAPNVTAIDARDGSIAGTIDLGGAPEQAASDGHGRVWIDLEDKDQVAVVDAGTLKVTAHYDLGGKGSGPAGLALDAKNHILFAYCRNPAVCVILNADNGSIITTLPIGNGVDGATFNPATLEAFSSQRDGTLTVIKENSPTDFTVEQNVPTKVGAKTCTFDAKSGQIFLITAEYGPAPAPTAAPAAATPPADGQRPRRGGRQGPMVPDSFTILAVGH
jgi:DNA-binding beta-propeller fold protein YncE